MKVVYMLSNYETSGMENAIPTVPMHIHYASTKKHFNYGSVLLWETAFAIQFVCCFSQP